MKLTVTNYLVVTGIWGMLTVSSALGQTGESDDIYQAIRKREFGTAAKEMAALEKAIAATKPDNYAPIEARLIAVLEAPESTMPGKQFACQMLRIVGSVQCIPTVSKLLADEQLSHVARQVVLGMKDPAIAPALLKALEQTRGQVRIGIINTIGDRRDRPSLEALAALLEGSDEATIRAALNALGKIGGSRVADALDRAKLSNALSGAWAQAYLSCAVSLRTRNSERADRMLHTLLEGEYPSPVRAGAFGALVQQQPEQAVPLIIKTLSSDNTLLRRAAVTAVLTLPGHAATQAFAQALAGLAPEPKTILVGALASRGDPTGLTEIFNQLAGDENQAIRATAITGLAQLGNASSVPVLVAAWKDKALATKATQSLLELRGEGVVQALIQRAETGDAVIRQGMLGVLADRRQVEALPVIRLAVQDEDPSIRRAGLKTLAILGTPEDFPWLAKRILTKQAASERDQIAQAMAAIGGRMSDKATRCEPVLQVLSQADDPTKVCLLTVLSKLGGESAMQAVRSALTGTSEVQKTAIRALADWPDSTPRPDLLRVAREDPETANQIVALRGYIRMIGLSGDPSQQKLKTYREAMDLASRPEEKRLVLAGLAEVAHVDALPIVETYLTDASLKQEAFVAYAKIAESLAGRQPAVAKPALQRVVEQATDTGVRNRAKRALERMK